MTVSGDPIAPPTALESALEWAAGYPEAVNALTTALLWSIGDVIAQFMERRLQRKQTHLPLTQSPDPTDSNYGSPINWRFSYLRTLRLAAFACFVFAPITKAWFELLVRMFPGDGGAVAIPRMVADQLLYAPCVISAVFMWTGLLESGGSLSFAVAKLRQNFFSALKSNWMLWPMAQLIIQGLIPLHLRMLVAACINVPWTVYLASKAAAPPAPPAAAKTVELTQL